jgi:hypothetical protein
MSTTTDTAPKTAETPAPPVSAAGQLKVALAQIEKAARMAGIEPDDPLGIWIDSLRAGLQLFADLSVESEARVFTALGGLKEAALEDTRRMKAAVAECDAATRKLQATYGTMETRVNNLIAQTIASMAGQVADQMRDQMVIVERRHNRVVLWKRAGFLAVIVVAIFGGGFGAARYVDQPAVRLLNQCLAHPLEDSQTGSLLCSMDTLRTGG